MEADGRLDDGGGAIADMIGRLRGNAWKQRLGKGPGGGRSSSSLPVSTLSLPRAPSLLCGEFSRLG